MTAAYFVIYQGVPDDPDAWVKYYTENHLPLVWKFPKIRGIDVHVGTGENDIFMITRLLFDDLADLNASITSAERKEAATDMNRHLLPHFNGHVRHQTTKIIAVGKPPST